MIGSGAVIPVAFYRTYAEPTIAQALALWAGSWSIDVPPTGGTGDADADKALSAAYRELAQLPGTDARQTWIEERVWRATEFPLPGQPTDIVRNTLLQWWLELFEASR